MELHRVRFINHVACAIQYLSFAEDGSKLALSRDDGSLEIWVTRNSIWSKDVWIPGRANTSIEALQWCGEQLFTGCLSGLLEEWDLVKLRPSRAVDACSGPIWCLQVKPGDKFIALGCENGKVCVYDVTTGILKSLHQFDVRVLSLVWHPTGSSLFVGGADSIIRKIANDSGNCIQEMVLDSSRKSIVWDLKYLEPYIVSADSNGRVTLWHDGLGTVSQCFTEHSADVLALAIDYKKGTIYSAGVDAKISRFRKITSKNEWIKDGDVTVHSNDVRGLDVSTNGLLASGGVDTQLFMINTKKFKNDCGNVYSHLQDSSRFFCTSDKDDIIMHQANSSVQLWQLSPSVGEVDLPHNMPAHLLEITTKGTNYILSSALSSDATKVAISTVKHFWLYNLNFKDLNFHCILSLDLPSYRQAFCCNDQWLIMACIERGLRVYDLQTNQWLKDGVDMKDIVDIFGSNGSYVILMNNCKELFVYDLDKRKFITKLPELGSNPLNFFQMSNTEFVICCCNAVYLYDLCLFQLTKLRDKMEKAKGFCMTDKKSLVAYDSKSLYVTDSKLKYLISVGPKELFSDSLIVFVSAFSDMKLVVVENLPCSTIRNSSQILFKDHYGT